MPAPARPSSHSTGKQSFQLFIVHLPEYKSSAIKLRDALSAFDVAGFVAHARAQRTPKWQENVMDQLRSSDALVALLHKGFYENEWTQQEIGAAVGCGLLVIPVTFGEEPRGFIGHYEPLQGKGKSYDRLADELRRVLKGHPQTRTRMAESLMGRVVASDIYRQAVQATRPPEEAE
jgi:hypothetical protein